MITMQCLSLSLKTVFILKSILSLIFILFSLAWNIFSHPLTFTVCVSLGLQWGMPLFLLDCFKLCGSISQSFIFKIMFLLPCLAYKILFFLRIRKLFVPVSVLACKQ